MAGTALDALAPAVDLVGDPALSWIAVDLLTVPELVGIRASLLAVLELNRERLEVVRYYNRIMASKRNAERTGDVNLAARRRYQPHPSFGS